MAADALIRLTTNGDEHIAIVQDGRLEGFLTRTDIERVLRIERRSGKPLSESRGD